MGSASKDADEQLEAELRGFNSDTPIATVKRTLTKFVHSSEKPRVSSQTLAALLEVVLIDWLPCFTEQERSDYFDTFFLDDGLSSTGKRIRSLLVAIVHRLFELIPLPIRDGALDGGFIAPRGRAGVFAYGVLVASHNDPHPHSPLRMRRSATASHRALHSEPRRRCASPSEWLSFSLFFHRESAHPETTSAGINSHQHPTTDRTQQATSAHKLSTGSFR